MLLFLAIKRINVKNFIFDIDGTLWDTTGVVAGAWNRAVSESGISAIKDIHITKEMLMREFGKPMDVIADDLFGDIDPYKKAELLKNCCKYEHEAILECNDDLSYKGMRETLKSLSKTHKLFIVSNCQDGYIELVIKKNGLDGLVTDFECFGHTGLSKRENIALVIKRNNLEINETAYVGDTLGDFEAAKPNELYFIFASYGFGNVPDADLTIKSIEELTAV